MMTDGMSVYDEHLKKLPMHPDDFTAHLAWVTAKRFHEHVLKNL